MQLLVGALIWYVADEDIHPGESSRYDDIVGNLSRENR
jgi:hypothetical protein